MTEAEMVEKLNNETHYGMLNIKKVLKATNGDYELTKKVIKLCSSSYQELVCEIVKLREEVDFLKKNARNNPL